MRRCHPNWSNRWEILALRYSTGFRLSLNQAESFISHWVFHAKMVDPFMIMMMNNADGQFHRNDPSATADYVSLSGSLARPESISALDQHYQTSKSSRTANQETGPNSIRVEESIDCREPSNSRLFLLKNLDTALDITINQNSTITSCRLEAHEIIVDPRSLHQRHEAWAQNIPSIVDANERTNISSNHRHHAINHKVQAFPWNSHVRGSELVLSTSNNSSSILYELTSYNELISTVKLKTMYAQHQPIYFNLNDAKEKAPIDGHTMLIQCNGNINRIQVQQTNLSCNCNSFSSMSPRSFIREIPVEIFSHNGLNPITLQPIEDINKINDDDLIICDAIYSLDSTCPLDMLQVQLQFQLRKLVIELRCNQIGLQQQPTSSSAPPQTTERVSSSTAISTSSTDQKLASHYKSAFNLSHGVPVTSEATSPSACCQESSTQDESPTRDVKPNLVGTIGARDPSAHDSKRTKLPTSQSTRTQNNTDSPAYLNHNTTLRLRIRVTNFGVCVVPFQMSHYSCSYKFSW